MWGELRGDRATGTITGDRSDGDRGRLATKRKKHTAYLIAVYQKRETVRVYAVMDQTAELARAQVDALATGAMRVEIVGALSRNLARQLALTPGQMLLV